MSAYFGTDLSRVRLHTDRNAAQASEALQAQAFTTGTDIFFGTGQYDPHTQTGRRLIAHEVAHVVQQNEGAVAPNLIQRQCADLTYVDASIGSGADFRDMQWTGECGSGSRESCVNGPVPLRDYQQWNPSGAGDYSRSAISRRHVQGTINHPSIDNCQIEHESWITWVTITEHDFPLQLSGDDHYLAVTYVYSEHQSGEECETTNDHGSEFRCQEVDSAGSSDVGDALSVVGTAATVAATIIPGVPPPP